MAEEWKIDFLKYDFCSNRVRYSKQAPFFGELNLGEKVIKTEDFILRDGARLLTNGFISGIDMDGGEAKYTFENPVQSLVKAQLKYLDYDGYKMFRV